MKRTRLHLGSFVFAACALLAACLLTAPLARAQNAIRLIPGYSLGPNKYAAGPTAISPTLSGATSPTFVQWNQNALFALLTGRSSVGHPQSDPAAYFRVAAVSPFDDYATAYRASFPDPLAAVFPSWRGKANPRGAFAAQYGNDLYSTVYIASLLQTFKVSNLAWEQDSSDSQDYWYTAGPSPTNSTFNANYVGIAFTADGLQVYENGEPLDTPVNVFIAPAFRLSVEYPDTVPGSPGLTDQQLIQYDFNLYLAPILPTTITQTFTLYADDGVTILAQGSDSVRMALPK